MGKEIWWETGMHGLYALPTPFPPSADTLQLVTDDSDCHPKPAIYLDSTALLIMHWCKSPTSPRVYIMSISLSPSICIRTIFQQMYNILFYANYSLVHKNHRSFFSIRVSQLLQIFTFGRDGSCCKHCLHLPLTAVALPGTRIYSTDSSEFDSSLHKLIYGFFKPRAWAEHPPADTIEVHNSGHYISIDQNVYYYETSWVTFIVTQQFREFGPLTG